MKVDNLTPVLTAAPGERATCRLRIENTEPAPLQYRLRIIGFDDTHVLRPPPSGPLASGAAEEVALEFVIPDAFAAGHHSVGVEVSSDRPGVAPAIAAVTVTVGTIDDVAIAVVPSTIRAHRRGSFRVDIDNRSNQALDLELAGEGPDLAVRLRPDRLVLRPGERVRTSGRVRGPRHLVGEPLQHSMTVTARSASAPSYAPATFQQRPLFPRGLRSMIAVLLVVAIWAAAVGAGYLWWTNRDDEIEVAPVELVDTDGDGQPDTPANQLIDTDGDGVPDTLAAVVAEQVATAGELGPPQEGGSDRPTRTVFGGTVKAGDTGDDAGVLITLTPLALGAAPSDGSTPAGLTGTAGQGRGVKLWPARFGRYEPAGALGVRQTVSVQSAAAGPDGAWRFADVPIGQHYEVSLARAGFDTQSFVVTPTPDGEPVELDVVLQPSSGSVSGVVVGPGGPLANVDLVLTDGTLTFHTSSASGTGAFLITGVSTPGTYTLTANLRGHGTEVIQAGLDPGENRSGLRIAMTPGVGSISGRVSEDGQPLGGVTLTASNGDVTRTTTSLTEGDRGLFTFPQLAIPGRYTVTAALDGYLTQSRVVTLTGNATGVDFVMVKTTGAITGIVESSNGGPLTGANIRVGRDKLFFDTNSAVAPDPGSFTITDLPPGTYLVEFSRFDHAPASQLVTVASGQVVDLGRIVLQFRDRPGIPETGSLEVSVIDSENTPLTGAEVRVVDVANGQVVALLSDEGVNAQSTFVFDPLPIGTYRLEVIKRPDFRLQTRRVSIGLGRATAVVQLFKLGQVAGRILDSRTLVELDDYAVQIFRITPGQPDVAVGPEISVPEGSPPNIGPNDDMVGWESPPNAPLTTGTYRIAIVDRPPGYRVLDQVLVTGSPAMQFEVRADSDAPIMFNDMLADLNPSLTGQIVVPRGTGSTSFAPVNDDRLAVRLQCGANGLSLDPANVDQLFSADGAPALDSYRFSAILIEENNLNGACEIWVSVDDPEFDDTTFAEGELVTVKKPLPSLLLPASPTVTGTLDKVVNVALVAARDIAGHAYWTDIGAAPPAGEPVDAAGVDVRTLGQVIVGFDPRDDGADPEPATILTSLSAVTDSDGRWLFAGPPKQVFGETTYEFSSPVFTTCSFPLTVSETGRSVPAPPPGCLGLAEGPGGVAVELDALGGPIAADLIIRTIKGTPLFPGTAPDVGDFTWTVTNGVTTLTDDVFAANPGPHRWEAAVATADPGTYEGSFTFDTGRYVPFQGANPSAIPITQPPGGAVRIERSFVELADLTVRVTDRNSPSTIVSATVTVSHDGPTGPGDPGDSSLPRPTTGGVAAFPGLAVNSETPESSPVRYQVTPAVSGYDTNSGVYTVTTETGLLPPTACSGVCVVDVDLLAGGRQEVSFSFPRFGSISGNVVGVVDALGNTEPLTLGGTPPVEITAFRVAGEDGVVLARPWQEFPVIQAGSGFTVSGTPGFYTFAVSHDEYEPLAPAGLPPCLAGCAELDDGGVLLRAWRMTNAQPNPAGTWSLEIAKGTLDLNAHEDVVGGTAISGATIVLTGPSGTVIPVDPTGVDGRRVVGGLFPGDYNVVIRRATGGEDEFFPVIATVNVPRGIDPGVRTRVVRAPLPRIGGWVAGLVVARNTVGRAVPVPAVTVRRSYTAPAVETEAQGSVATIPNQADEGDINRPPGLLPAPTLTTAGSATGAPERYEFENLATGSHVVTFDPATGYDVTPGPKTVTVVDTDPPDPATEVNTTDAVYIAANRTVLITVETPGGVAVTDATVSLTSPAPGSTPVLGTHTTGGVYSFAGVPPDLAAYTATATKPLHTPTSISVIVPPGVGAFTAPDPIELPAAVAEITGIARKQQTPTQAPPLPPLTGPDGGLVRLISLASGDEVASIVPDGTGRYTFQVAAGDIVGQYQVRVEAPGFAPRASGPITAVAGASVTVPDVVVPALATFTVRVIGPPAAEISVVIAVPPTQAGTGPTTVSGRDFTFRVDPDAAYRFTAAATGFISQTVPATAFDPAIGQSVPRIDVTLQRTITGTVTPAAAGITVEATAPGQTTLTDDTDATGRYELIGAGAATWTIVAEQLGIGRGSIERTIADSGPAVTGANITLAARPVHVTFTVDPPTVTVTLSNGASGTATGGTITLDVAENAFPVTWTATFDGRLIESAALARDVNETDTFDLTELTQDGPSIALDLPTMSATVLAPGGTAVTTAAVFICPGGSGACVAGTTDAISAPFVAARSRYEAQPTASGPWRIAATNGTDSAAAVPFTVAADGTITPTPPTTLQLVTPP